MKYYLHLNTTKKNNFVLSSKWVQRDKCTYIFSCANHIRPNLSLGGAVEIKDTKKQNEQTKNTEGNR